MPSFQQTLDWIVEQVNDLKDLGCGCDECPIVILSNVDDPLAVNVPTVINADTGQISAFEDHLEFVDVPTQGTTVLQLAAPIVSQLGLASTAVQPEDLPFQPVKSVKLLLSMDGTNTGSGFFPSATESWQKWGFTGNINFNWINNVLTITSADSEFTLFKTFVLPSSGHVTSATTSVIEITFNNLTVTTQNNVELNIYA